jgi:hypothetical protein
MAYINFKKWVLSCNPSGLYQDFIHGVSIVRIKLSIFPEQAFMEMDKIRLQHRLLRIRKRLFNAYRRLGEQGLNYQGVAEVALERCIQIEQCYQQIEKILKDHNQVLDEIEQVVSETPHEGEIKNAE